MGAADNIVTTARREFPVDPVTGSEEAVVGPGPSGNKEYPDPIKSFTWGPGGQENLKITKVQEVSISKTGSAGVNVDISEITGVFKADTVTKSSIRIRKANIVHFSQL